MTSGKYCQPNNEERRVKKGRTTDTGKHKGRVTNRNAQKQKLASSEKKKKKKKKKNTRTHLAWICFQLLKEHAILGDLAKCLHRSQTKQSTKPSLMTS